MQGSTICKQHVILTGVPRGATGWTWRAARGATAGLKTRWRLVQRLNTAAVSIRYRRLFSLFSGLTDSGFDFIPPMESSPTPTGWLTDGSSNHLPGTFWKCVRSSKQFFCATNYLIRFRDAAQSNSLTDQASILCDILYLAFKINILIQWCFHQPQLGLVFSVSMLIQRWRASLSVLSGVELTADSRQTRILVAAGFSQDCWQHENRISAASSVPGVMMERHGASTAAAESVRWH